MKGVKSKWTANLVDMVSSTDKRLDVGDVPLSPAPALGDTSTIPTIRIRNGRFAGIVEWSTIGEGGTVALEGDEGYGSVGHFE